MIVHVRADQLLPQLLMQQFDTLHSQCWHVEHMHEEVFFLKKTMTKWQLWELRQFSPSMVFVYAYLVSLCADQFRQINTILFLHNEDILNICMKWSGAKKNNNTFLTNDSFENLCDFCICIYSAKFHYHSFWWSNLIFYLHIVVTLGGWC